MRCFPALAVIPLLFAPLGCKSLLGEPCTLDGVMNDEVSVQPEAEECDGLDCMYLEDYGTFCTDNCIDTSDCPNGFECAQVDLLPSAAEDLRSVCIPDTPIDPGDDDDDTTPVGEPPEISDLVINHALDPPCNIKVRCHWHDEDGDLNGADAYIEFVDPAVPDKPHEFFTNIEQLDAVDADLIFLIEHDGDPLAYNFSYNVYLTLVDRAGNESNQLAQGGYTTPSASCE